MSIIFKWHYYCDTCEFKVTAHAGRNYIIGPSGERCYLRGIDFHTVCKAMGTNPKSGKEVMEIMKEVREKDLVKSDSPMICWQCLNTTYLDYDEDDLICSRCESTNLSSVHRLVDEPCPICELGTFCVEMNR